MSLIPCPECQRSISDRARTCPGCGYPLAEPWTDRLRRAWRQGFHHAWIAAAGFGIVVSVGLVAAVAADPTMTTSELLLPVLPWLVIFPIYGFLAGLMAIALAAYLRSRRRRAASGADIWRWSVPAAIGVVALFAAFLTGTTIV